VYPQKPVRKKGTDRGKAHHYVKDSTSVVQ